MLMRVLWAMALVVSLTAAPLAESAQEGAALKVDNEHVEIWNRFAKQLMRLHKQRIAAHEVTKSEELGGYYNMPEFYKEVTYRDAESGHVLSRIQWETEDPDQAHVIQTYFYDDQGRVIRDYSAAFLPGHRNAPIQTLIALHNYNQDLHAFRTFDASGDRIFERCQGRFQGKEVDLRLEDYQIRDALRDPKSIMAKPLYKACFQDLQEKAGKYLTPQ